MATTVVSKSYNKKATPIIQYTTELSTASFTPLQKELLDATLSKAHLPGMLGAPEVLEMGKSMINLNQSKKVLDIGTFTGASALAWAIELPKDGKVISMDVDHTQLEKVGLPVINKAPELKTKIDFRLGSAVDTLKSLIANGESGSFGFAFIDADKENYPNYYELCLQLLCPGGVIMVDNVCDVVLILNLITLVKFTTVITHLPLIVPDQSLLSALWGGSVVEPVEESSKAIDKLNRIASADSRVHNTLLNVGDGVHLIVKKH
ncbi:comt-4 [Pristionchus pacificus]|uniref:Comt-4 n=1 Tax=Pristionchus pacificus TaxID=54126 RepID=A0A2A6C3P1_PRIPA|nr:comt-4 [Pristionchus pacificus]|eukprot:PDM72795.1 comt-4 [Pristionchus pacificus]